MKLSKKAVAERTEAGNFSITFAGDGVNPYLSTWADNGMSATVRLTRASAKKLAAYITRELKKEKK